MRLAGQDSRVRRMLMNVYLARVRMVGVVLIILMVGIVFAIEGTRESTATLISMNVRACHVTLRTVLAKTLLEVIHVRVPKAPLALIATSILRASLFTKKAT